MSTKTASKLNRSKASSTTDLKHFGVQPGEKHYEMNDLTNIGPLTTRYSPVGSGCRSSVLVIPTDIKLFVEGDATRTSTEISGDWSFRTYGDLTSSPCFPPNYMSSPDFQPGYGMVRYYSPGICPSGYDIAASWKGSRDGIGTSDPTDDAAKRDIGVSSRETTTAICCPR